MQMKDPYQKVVAASAVLLLVVAAVVGYRVIRQLDRMARAAAEKPAPIPAQVRIALRPRVAGSARGPVAPEREESDLPPAALRKPVVPAVALPKDRSRPAFKGEGSLLPADDAPGADLRLVPDLPRSLFQGVPGGLEGLTLQDPWEGVGGGIVVPRGTRLLSAGKPVTSSDAYPVIGDLSMVTDGDKTGVDGAFVELGEGPQWIQIDLQSEHAIHAIAVWHYHLQPRAYHDVVVLLSRTADFSTSTTLFNNDAANTLGLGAGTNKEYLETNRGLLLNAGGAKARYVRLHSNGSTANAMNHYVEVEVYGLP